MNSQIKLNCMNAILGVFGSGKSTLLKGFLSKTDDRLPEKYNGKIFLNNSTLQIDQTTKSKSIYLVFVGQKDLFYESKNLKFKTKFQF